MAATGLGTGITTERTTGLATGFDLGLALCERCRLVVRWPQSAGGRNQAPGAAQVSCPRCDATLWLRKPASLSRATAFLVAAYICYIPANVLPVIVTTTVLGTESDTILSGAIELIETGSWPLGAVVFIASICVPLLKLVSLTLLIASVARGSGWGRLQQTRLYRLIELVGRWSMLDVYVVTLLVGLVQFRSLATVTPGIGALAFGAVVVFTMLAVLSFDPRLIWDTTGEPRAGR